MKKYISIIAVSFALFVGATSCQLNGGSGNDPNRANRMLWHRVYSSLTEQYEYVKVVALLNDKMRGKEYVDDMVWKITESAGVYTITLLDGPNTASYITYLVDTGGKRIDEGGEWQLSLRWNDYMEYEKLGYIQGVMNVASELQLFAIETTPISRGQYQETMSADVEYLYDTIEESLNITFTKVQGLSTDNNFSNIETQYTIDYTSSMPLIFRGAVLYSGEIDILYKDFVEKTERTVIVKIVDKIITFAE